MRISKWLASSQLVSLVTFGLMAVPFFYKPFWTAIVVAAAIWGIQILVRSLALSHNDVMKRAEEKVAHTSEEERITIESEAESFSKDFQQQTGKSYEQALREFAQNPRL